MAQDAAGSPPSPTPAPAAPPPPSTARLSLDSLRADDGTGLRFRFLAGNGAEGVMDSGKGAAGPSPVETVLVALGSCTAMDVISILRKKRQDVTAYDVEVTGHRRAEHPRIFTRIEVVHRFRGPGLAAAAVEEAIELSETKYCSVSGMLRASAEITSRYEIADA